MTKFKYFEVTLDDAIDTAVVGEGFVDSRKAEDFDTLPSTLALSQDKARANLRWQQVIESLLESGAVDVIDITPTGGSQDTPPTDIIFKVVYESDKTVFIYDLISDTTGATIYGPGDFTGGETELQTIERTIANALAVPITRPRMVYDPTLLGGKNTITKKFEDVIITALGTGATDINKRDNIEAQGAFTVTSVAV